MGLIYIIWLLISRIHSCHLKCNTHWIVFIVYCFLYKTRQEIWNGTSVGIWVNTYLVDWNVLERKYCSMSDCFVLVKWKWESTWKPDQSLRLHFAHSYSGVRPTELRGTSVSALRIRHKEQQKRISFLEGNKCIM